MGLLRRLFSGSAGDDLPVMSVFKNGNRVLGFTSMRAQERYDSGVPPMHGLAKGSATAAVHGVWVGDELKVERRGDRWFAVDAAGEDVGRLRWTKGLDGQKHPVSGRRIRLPASGVLVVERVVVTPDDVVVDIGGYVQPA